MPEEEDEPWRTTYALHHMKYTEADRPISDTRAEQNKFGCTSAMEAVCSR